MLQSLVKLKFKNYQPLLHIDKQDCISFKSVKGSYGLPNHFSGSDTLKVVWVSFAILDCTIRKSKVQITKLPNFDAGR